jgi:hypothetical protein
MNQPTSKLDAVNESREINPLNLWKLGIAKPSVDACNILTLLPVAELTDIMCRMPRTVRWAPMVHRTRESIKTFARKL